MQESFITCVQENFFKYNREAERACSDLTQNIRSSFEGDIKSKNHKHESLHILI